MQAYIFPYNTGSESAKALAGALKIQRIKREGSKFKGDKNKLVINWGARSLPEEVTKCNILNTPEAIITCSDKLTFFKILKEKALARTPDFTTNMEEACAWVKSGKIVVCRTILNGHSGEGIVLAEEENELVAAPLYTKYVPKKEEYRVHIFRGQVFITQRKALKEAVFPEQVNWKIRNVANGFLFARNEGTPIPEDVHIQAMNAFNSVEGLDFCSVDVVWNEFQQKAYVLEINTASGLTGTTIQDYANKFKEVM